VTTELAILKHDIPCAVCKERKESVVFIIFDFGLSVGDNTSILTHSRSPICGDCLEQCQPVVKKYSS